jgi:hypothetical protein
MKTTGQAWEGQEGMLTAGTSINVKRTHVKLYPDRTRVLLQPLHLMSDQRALNICARVMALPKPKSMRCWSCGVNSVSGT